MQWALIEYLPTESRNNVLLYNELWEDTFGAIQIGYWDGSWHFQSEMSLDNEPDEMMPKYWQSLPEPPK